MNTEEALSAAGMLFAEDSWAVEITEPTPDRLDMILTEKSQLSPLVMALRAAGLGWLSAITALDGGPQADILEVLYHFCTAGAVITARVQLSRANAQIASLSSVLSTAEVFEREVREMFGIEFTGLPGPDYLYLPDDWPNGLYPMRKDADLTTLSANQRTDAC